MAEKSKRSRTVGRESAARRPAGPVRMSATEAGRSLAATVRRVAARGKPVILQSRGQDLAALIPLRDLHLLERLREEEEDRRDIADAERAIAEMEAGLEKPLPYEQVRRELGL